MSNHPIDIPYDADRSILARMGLNPLHLLRPDRCGLCGRSQDDGARFFSRDVVPTWHTPMGNDRITTNDPDYAEQLRRDGRTLIESLRPWAAVGGSLQCVWCSRRLLQTPRVDLMFAGLDRWRMKSFGAGWRKVETAFDGAAYVHDVAKLHVVESIAVAHGKEDDPTWQDRVIAGRPQYRKHEFGETVVVMADAGHDDDPDDDDVLITELWTGDLWTDAVRDAVWRFNAQNGWEWWHQVAVARIDRGTPSLSDVAMVRRSFITEHRECAVLLPATPRDHSRPSGAIQLMHCMDQSANDPDTGRVLPAFEAEIIGPVVPLRK